MEKLLETYTEYADFKGDKLFHHQIGEDGQAVAVPEKMHSGSGGIHNAEKSISVTGNAETHSQKVQEELNDGYIKSGDDVWSSLDNVNGLDLKLQRSLNIYRNSN